MLTEREVINALNEWFIGECHERMCGLAGVAENEWHQNTWRPVSGNWLAVRLCELWIERVRLN